MSKTIVTQNPVRLEGYQAVFQPSKFGNLNLACIVTKVLSNNSKLPALSCLSGVRARSRTLVVLSASLSPGRKSLKGCTK